MFWNVTPENWEEAQQEIKEHSDSYNTINFAPGIYEVKEWPIPGVEVLRGANPSTDDVVLVLDP